jgi:hypothetical protein
LFGDVERSDFGLEAAVPQLMRSGFQRGGVAAVEDHRGACLREPLGHREAESARRACDKRDAPGERE